MKARTMAFARGERRIAPDEPKVWFTSTESFAKVLSAAKRDLSRVIAERAPDSLDKLVGMTGRPNRTCPADCVPWWFVAWRGWNAVSADESRRRLCMTAWNSTSR
jgi:hypothetical protein